MKFSLLIAALLTCSALAFAQHGTAGNGYYPPGYTGDTWTGIVVSASEQTREITLSYTNPKNGKTETFIGVPEQEYLVHEHGGVTRPLKMSDVPLGRTVKVWYLTETKKIKGKKTTINTIFQISVAANVHRTRSQFMAFG